MNEQLHFVTPCDVTAMSYIKNYIRRFPAASMQDVQEYVQREFAFALEVPRVQQWIAQLLNLRHDKNLPN